MNRRHRVKAWREGLSWRGPGTVICMERNERTGAPRKAWVRFRGKIKGYARGADELKSSKAMIEDADPEELPKLEDGDESSSSSLETMRRSRNWRRD